MTIDAKTLLKFANVQMAAEALLDRPGDFAGQLIYGNNRSSKFTETQATDFSTNWTVVEHKANTATGFSGTLFENNATKETIGVRLQLNHFSKDCENAISGTFTDKIFSSSIDTGATSS